MTGSPRPTGGLDWFRLAAILLVAANHTGPLRSIAPTANYLVTDILARLAVPFFLAVSGYFLLPRVKKEGTAILRPFFRRCLLLYAGAALLYLPLKLALGIAPSPLELVRDVLFEGVYYHLWYFPAVFLGLCIVAHLYRWGTISAIALCSVLYLIGLLGDSYYGLSAALPFLDGFYYLLFALFGQSRNGLFLAPIFLVLGGVLAERPIPHKLQPVVWRLCAALLMLVAEGMLVRNLGLARYTTMYLSLPLCLWFLMDVLRTLPLPPQPRLRTFSTAFYILHPLCIIGVRGMARLMGLTSILVDISPLYYCAVVGSSALLSFPFLFLSPRQRQVPLTRAWLENDPAALSHNLTLLSSLLPSETKLMAVLKANAYGHGAIWAARLCQKEGVQSFAVATAEEGTELRRHGIRGLILVLGYTAPAGAPLLSRYHLTQTIISPEHALALEQTGYPLAVHIKVDTGLHRLGFSWRDGAALATPFCCPHLRVTGLFTHLSDTETIDRLSQERTREELRRFEVAAHSLEVLGHYVPAKHIQSSYGLLNDGPLPGMAYVRVGIALYGVLSSSENHILRVLALHPVLSLRAKVTQVQELVPGEPAGYGGTFLARRPTRLATVAIGYADGIPRSLSLGRGGALLHGQYAPIVATVCMDQLLLDVTDVPAVTPGDNATFFGLDGTEFLSIETMAEQADTITNELLSRLGPRLPRVVKSYD